MGQQPVLATITELWEGGQPATVEVRGEARALEISEAVAGDCGALSFRESEVSDG